MGDVLQPVENFVKGALGDQGWNGFRNSLETGGSLVGNYLLPGSSLLSDQLVSKGSQGQLGSTIGELAQAGTGLAGAGVGSSFTGIPSAADVGAGYTNAANGVGGLFGDSTLGSDISGSLSNLGTGLGFGSSPSASGVDAGTSSDAFAPSTQASGAAGTTGSGILSSSGNAGLGGGTSGGFSSLSPVGDNTNSGFFTPDLNGNPTAGGGNFGGIGATQSNGGLLSQLGQATGLSSNTPQGSYNFDINGNPVGNSALPAAQSVQSGITDGITQGGNVGSTSNVLSSLNGNNMLNGSLRAGLSSLFNQNPYGNFGQVANTLNQQGAAYNPYVQGGSQAQGALNSLYGLNGNGAQAAAQANWQNTPGYQFQLQQGTGALQNSAAAAGGLLNGNTGEALQQYGQGLANTAYQQYLGNLQNQVGTGQNALGAQSNLYGQASIANQAPGMYKAQNANSGIGGLLGSLFPTVSNNQNGSNYSGLLSYL
jgi:hypothetical protein